MSGAAFAEARLSGSLLMAPGSRQLTWMLRWARGGRMHCKWNAAQEGVGCIPHPPCCGSQAFFSHQNSCCPAVLGALNSVDQHLQALRAALAASAAAADSGQRLAGIVSAWGALMNAYNGSQVGCDCTSNVLVSHCRWMVRRPVWHSESSPASAPPPCPHPAPPPPSFCSCRCRSCRQLRPPCRPPPHCWACQC